MRQGWDDRGADYACERLLKIAEIYALAHGTKP